MTDGSRSGWQGRSPVFRVVVAVAVAVLVGFVSLLIRNPDMLHRVTGAGHAVGDCVRVEPGLNGSTMKDADCSSAENSMFSGDPVYQVSSVEDGKDASCPGGGFDHVTFSNEPENMTYCLVMK